MNSSAVTAWQNDHTNPAVAGAMLKTIAETGTRCPEVSRGFVTTGPVAEVADFYSGGTKLLVGPASFTTHDAVADEFAQMGEPIPADQVRVKMWVSNAPAVELVDGDPSFGFEREWVVAGEFFTEVEVVDAQTVVVYLTPVENVR